MYYKVLIIDDNHSFIDSLKFSLEKYHFQYDHAFKFHAGLSKIEQNGSLIKRSVLNKIDDFNTKIITLENSETIIDSSNLPDFPVLPPNFSSLVDANGYFLIIIEHDSENMMKGLDFIQQVVKSNPYFQVDDFVLLTHRFSEIKTQAAKYKIPCFDKRMTNEDFHNHLIKKIKSMGQQIEQSGEIYRIFTTYKSKYFQDSTPVTKKKTSSTKKKV